MRKLAVAALAALTIACAAEVPASASAARPAWAADDIQPVGQPVAVGAAIIGYVQRGARTYVQGRKPSDGAVLWESEAVAGVAAQVGEWVAYLQPEEAFGSGYASLVVADPITGTQAHRSPAMIFDGVPQACFGGGAVCVSAAREPGDPLRGYRLAFASGAFMPFAEGVPGEGAVRIGSEFVLVQDGVVRWRRPVPGAVSWTQHAGVWVVVTATGSVGLSSSDGSPLWSLPGVVRDCGVPLRGAAVRCREGRLEGFDPRTGKARWSVPLHGTLAVAGASTVVVQKTSIALDTGARTVAKGSFWCVTGGLARTCGDPGLPPAAAWAAVGAVAGGYAVVGTAAGFLGMPVGVAGTSVGAAP